MPSYNSANTIKKSIGCVLNQSYRNWELLIVDDGSNDETASIVKSFIENDSRIKLIKQDHLGPGEARNKGISISSGDYVAFLDSDDYWDFDFLERVNVKASEKQYDVIFYDLVLETPEGKRIGERKSSQFSGRTISDLVDLQMVGTLMWGMTKVIRKSLISNNSVRFTKAHVGEEAVFSFDVLKKAENVGFIEKGLYHYVDYSTGQHSKGGNDPWGPVVINMKNHLTELGLINDYKATLSTLAFKAFCIKLYRLAKKGVPRKELKAEIRCFKNETNLADIRKELLDRRSLILRFFVEFNCVFPIVAAARMNRK